MIRTFFRKGPFKYYVIKEVGGWGQKVAIFDDTQYSAQWLSIVLGRHFKVPVLLGISLIRQYSPKSTLEFKFCAKRAISGSYGAENSQNFQK